MDSHTREEPLEPRRRGEARPRGRRTSVGALVTGGITALAALAGCGGNDDSSGDAIKIMTYADITAQPPAPSSKFISESVRAAIDAANDDGGIDGRPIELIICDTKMDPNAAAACGRKAIEEDVVAVVGGQSIFDSQLAPIVEEAGIPMIGPIALSPQVFNGSLTYCHTAQTSTSLALMPAVAKQIGVTKLSLVIIGGTPLTESNTEAFEDGVEEAGLEVGNVVTPSAQTTNFAAAATEAAADGADGVIVLPLSETAAIAQQIKDQEPQLKIILPSFAFSFGGEWPASLNGTTVVAGTQPPTSTEVPGIERYLTEMKEHAPDTDLTETSAYQWLAGDWFVRAASEIEGEVTADSIVEQWDTLEDFDMGGITPPYDAARRGTVTPEQCGVNTTVVHAELQDNQIYAVKPGEFVD